MKRIPRAAESALDGRPLKTPLLQFKHFNLKALKDRNATRRPRAEAAARGPSAPRSLHPSHWGLSLRPAQPTGNGHAVPSARAPWGPRFTPGAEAPAFSREDVPSAGGVARGVTPSVTRPRLLARDAAQAHGRNEGARGRVSGGARRARRACAADWSPARAAASHEVPGQDRGRGLSEPLHA